MFTFISTLKMSLVCASDVPGHPTASLLGKCYLYTYESFPPLTAAYPPAFYQRRTVTRTTMDMVQLSSQISGLGGLHCSEQCTYSSDNCGGLRSVGARLTGLCGSQSEADWVYKMPVASVISENGLSRQSN